MGFLLGRQGVWGGAGDLCSNDLAPVLEVVRGPNRFALGVEIPWVCADMWGSGSMPVSDHNSSQLVNARVHGAREPEENGVTEAISILLIF